jgi:uncharacterized protein YbaP (TraB family)
MMSALPDGAQEFLLVDAIEGGGNPLEILGQIDGIFEAWQAGDGAAIAQLAIAGEDDPEELQVIDEFMLDRRNRAMVERIEELLAVHESLFVVVGAAHLVGEQGLVELFEQRGYVLTQLPKEAATASPGD